MTTLFDRYMDAHAVHGSADVAWNEALEAAYGHKAGRARYDRRGHATPKLARLLAVKHAACIEQSIAFHACMKVGGFAEAKKISSE